MTYTRSLILCVCFVDRCLAIVLSVLLLAIVLSVLLLAIVLSVLLLAIVLSVLLRYTDSDHSFGMVSSNSLYVSLYSFVQSYKLHYKYVVW